MRRRPGFLAGLGALTGLGLAVRLFYALSGSKDIPVTGDALTFHVVAGQLAAGSGFTRPPIPGLPAPLGTGPTAEHPPLFEALLAVLDHLHLTAVDSQKAALAFVGSVTVILVGLAARRLAGDRAGLIAAGIAALYPFLWVADGSLMSESLYGAAIAGVLLASLWLLERPTVRRALVLGALIGLAALTRGEAVFLVVLLLLPLARHGRARLAALAAVACVVVIAPWTIRNLATFHDPVPLSTNGSAVFAGANAPDTYHGRFLGLWRFGGYGRRPPGDESEKAAAYRSRGLHFARDHAGRVPVVLLARLGRVWDVYRPGDSIDYEYFEGRSHTATELGLWAYYPVLALALLGGVVVRRRRGPLLPFVSLALLVSLTALLSYGITRFRFAAEPALVVLAAVGVDAVGRRVRVRRS